MPCSIRYDKFIIILCEIIYFEGVIGALIFEVDEGEPNYDDNIPFWSSLYFVSIICSFVALDLPKQNFLYELQTGDMMVPQIASSRELPNGQPGDKLNGTVQGDFGY